MAIQKYKFSNTNLLLIQNESDTPTIGNLYLKPFANAWVDESGNKKIRVFVFLQKPDIDGNYYQADESPENPAFHDREMDIKIATTTDPDQAVNLLYFDRCVPDLVADKVLSINLIKDNVPTDFSVKVYFDENP